MRAGWIPFVLAALGLAAGRVSAAELVSHWPLVANARDVVGRNHAAVRGGVVFTRVADRPGADFNGRDAFLEVPDDPTLRLGRDDFSLALWVRPTRPLAGVPGDLISKWDASRRRGVNLYVAGSSSAYSGICDSRHVHFGIDDAFTGPERDHGKPAPSNSLVSNLVVFKGQLYAGIADASEPGKAARVFRLTDDDKWEDCGRLGEDPTIPSVMSMIVHDGRLYAGTGAWDWIRAYGKVKDQPPPRSTRVFVYEGGKAWRDLGEVGKGSRVLCLGSYKGTLFAGLDRVGGGKLFRREGDRWVDCGAPDGRNLENIMPWDGKLWVATHGNVYRYEADGKFTRVGNEPHGINQIHALHVFGGRLVAGTWPQGYVLRYAGETRWDIIGRLGLPPDRRQINETNDLEYHNGKLYAGQIPLAELYRHEADGRWERIGQLGRRASWAEGDADTWMRLTALASYGGRLFAGTGSCRGRAIDCDPEGTLGRVRSFAFGQMASFEHDLPAGWVHLTAVRRGRSLELYLDGKPAAKSLEDPTRALDLSTAAPLRIGLGGLTYFAGALSNVRLYRGALSEREIAELGRSVPGSGGSAAPRQPLFRTVDLNRGEAQEVELTDGTKVKIKLLEVEEVRDSLRSAIRLARVKVEINGSTATLTSGNYRLPVTVAGVQIDCPVTRGFYRNCDPFEDSWGLDKDARLRLWLADSPWFAPGTFVYPAKQRWFANPTQMGNEPSYVDGGDVPHPKRGIYYHSGNDIGGCEGMVDVVSACDGLVVSAGGKAMPEHSDAPFYKPRGDYDYVYVLDAHGWYYRYAHLRSIDPAVQPGKRVKMGQKIGVLGKEGSSGGWAHLHFDIKAKQPSSKWGIHTHSH